jgi:hypothetical protein
LTGFIATATSEAGDYQPMLLTGCIATAASEAGDYQPMLLTGNPEA